jgi:two-component system CheB/CheR fusion protein
VIRNGAAIEKEIRMDSGHISLMQVTPYIKQDGQRDGVVINFIDISEVRRLNSMLEAIFNSSSSAILAQRVVRDKQGKPVDFEVVQANETVEYVFGVLPQKIKGKRMSDFLPELMLTHRDQFLQAAMSTNKVEFEYYGVENDQWLQVIIARMQDDIVASFTDITQKKKALDLLEQNFAELKSTSTQLEKTNFKLQQSNMDLLQFASVASHDLKEPLRKVQAFGNMLKEKVRSKLDEKESNYLDIMIRSSNRMQTLIEDILLLSKLSNNDVERKAVDLNETVKNIVDDLEVTIKEKNARIEFEALPTIQAVPGQLHQLFLNLISNALKFNENGHPHVKIFHCDVDASQLHSGDKPEEFICLRVQDNGIGFKPEYKEKIFGIFKRLEGMKYQGAGIGLAICKRIVDNHHGYIAADGKPGEGAVFTVMLPHKAK